MAFPSFVVEAVAASGPVSTTVTAISPEVAIKRGRDALTETHGKVRKVTVRYAASDNRFDANDFVDPNRAAGDGSED